MDTSSLTGLLNNAVLLLALGVIYDVLGLYSIANKHLREILSGLLIGAIGIAVMLTPWELTPGVFFDTRWVLLSLCGLFFGLVPTAIAVAITVGFRLFQGGTGAIVGTVVIIVTAAVGLGWRYWRNNLDKSFGWLQMYLFGFVVQLAMLACMLLMPADMRWKIISTVGPPILAIYPVGTMLMGLLLGRQRDRQAAEDEIRFKNTVLATQQEASIDGILTVDTEGMIISSNQRFIDMWGINPDVIESKSDERAIYSILHKLVDSNQFIERVRYLYEHRDESSLEEVALKDGRTIERYSAPMIGVNGQYFGRHWTFRDITEKRQAEEKIKKQANFDSVTGLPNRHMLYDRLVQELKKAHRSNLSLAVMFLDLDHFKEVNDALGHDRGDLLLKESAKRLCNCVREADTVARQGGDEFTIILGEIRDSESVERVADNILKALAEPFQLEGEVAYISASIGITFYPEDASEVDALLKNADQAMYAAKKLGRNRFNYFTPFMQEAAMARMQVANDLRVAVADDQFTVHYQPIVELTSGSIHKAEALIRWQHPIRGMVSPVEFIHIAEETGIIIRIGDWVFREVALQVAIWRESYHPEFQISVNTSPVQFRDERCSHRDWFIHLEKLGLPGQAIAVEITEGLLMDATGNVVTDKLLAVRDADIQVSLDDFGTGYSSLSYLKRFDIDYLKIDQSFVRNLEPNSDDMALCDAIIVMAHKLGIKVIAEGVETNEQRDLLLAAGCDYGQGYLFAGAVPADELEEVLALVKR